MLHKASTVKHLLHARQKSHLCQTSTGKMNATCAWTYSYNSCVYANKMQILTNSRKFASWYFHNIMYLNVATDDHYMHKLKLSLSINSVVCSECTCSREWGLGMRPDV